MESLQDLIEEAKLRVVWWAVCIIFVSYILSLTSRSTWMNIPIAAIALAVVRMLSREVEFRWKARPAPRKGYLAHLEKKQLAVDDPILSTSPSVAINWVRKIDSPLVEAALDEFIGKVLKDFVVDMWYSSITPDTEAPELIRAIVNDVFGEIAERARDVNLVNLLTRDIVKLIGNHLDLYRRNQSAIGVELLSTLSLDARDEKLRRHLFASKELHPALISPECEYKVLQQMMGAVLAVVLRPREAQCPLVRCMSRELLTCLVMQPVMNLVNPGYINELIEYILLTKKDDRELDAGKPSHVASQNEQTAMASAHSKDKRDPGELVSSANQGDLANLVRIDGSAEASSSMASHVKLISSQTESEHHLPSRTAEWARGFEAARERRTEVLAPENLENLWTKGRNYKAKFDAHDNPGPREAKPPIKAAGSSNITGHERNLEREMGKEGSLNVKSSKPQLKRSKSSSFITKNDVGICEASTSRISHAVTYEESNCMDLGKPHEETNPKSTSELVFNKEQSSYLPKFKCRVVGAYFEKGGSKSFAVYSIAVASVDNETWFVKRRYRNFERLHRHLKDMPNYSLQLPPKRFLSSSIDDYFVHQRCILLDKYLQDLLSIPNVAEQHEVWDFLSASSKNYSFGKSTSVMKTLAVNVDDAMDDIVRQFKGVNGLIRKVVGSPDSSSLTTRSSGISLTEDLQQQSLSYSQREISRSASEDEDHVSGATLEEMGSSSRPNGWHSDNELDSRQFPPRVVKRYDSSRRYDSSSSMGSLRNQQSDTHRVVDTVIPSHLLEDPTRVPPEWTPPNVSIPLLDLVDTIFQLKQRGWLRRQVFWMSKQILQLLMEDAIDDWLLRQIHWLRREDVIAQGIKWLQDVLWPEGTFFLKLRNDEDKDNGESYQSLEKTGGSSGSNSSPVSFEMQREAARRASDVKKMILGGAPYTLVNLIGQKQYQRCAKDIYFFLQSTTCLKQLAYSILELLLVSVFPELNDVILDIHKKAFH
ncbi:uncharacterized protein LOC116252506 isoform X2 [Nymphaea colorata]|uniref:uncharacterized protein LOC116252506 isoform X2 n=1 Tax=Nymphaea colorata TaxID=210225 RepID=UPI00129E55BE|nr:uncharacterized protein LOC116252506 isoform X2 [Nymphaea colorata]